MDKSAIQDKIDEGALLARSIVQIVGKPKEHIEETLQKYIEEIKKDSSLKSGFTVLDEQYASAEKQDDSDLFSVFCDVEILCNDAQALMNFCMDVMPASIEIVEPEETSMTSHGFTGLMNDFLGKLHDTDMLAKQSKQQFKVMAQSMGIMTQNAILILLNLGPRDKENIAKVVGVEQEQITRFLDKLVADGKVKETDGKYALIPQ